MEDIDKTSVEIIRMVNGKPFRGIDLQLQLGMITEEKHAYYLARGTYNFITPAPNPLKETWFPHRWCE